MTTTYALLNPNDGTYSFHTDLDSLKTTLVKQALDFYWVHTHDTPYSLVCKSPDGSQTWRTPQGDEILYPSGLTTSAIAELNNLLDNLK